MAGLNAAASRGFKGGRPKVLDDEKLAAIQQMLAQEISKALICRTFNLPRSTLNTTLSCEIVK